MLMPTTYSDTHHPEQNQSNPECIARVQVQVQLQLQLRSYLDKPISNIYK